MAVAVTLAICTYSPHRERFDRVLDGLRKQTFDRACWELLVIDNNSPADNRPLQNDVAWHCNGRLVAEPRSGITYARERAASEAQGDLIVFCDDDNVLDPSYIQAAFDAMFASPELGVAAGISTPDFEAEPAPELVPFLDALAIRNLGEAAKFLTPADYPVTQPLHRVIPFGAGMVVRRAILREYFSDLDTNQYKLSLGRRGNNGGSCEDMDISLTALRAGHHLAYLPSLRLTHIIPHFRTQPPYLTKLFKSAGANWVQVSIHHRHANWKPIPRWTLPIRKLKVWLALRAWDGDVNLVRWSICCGRFEGQARLGEGLF